MLLDNTVSHTLSSFDDNDPNERARQSVTKAIRGAIRKVADNHAPLGRYLSNTIRTGITCCFDPDPGRPLSWCVEA